MKQTVELVNEKGVHELRFLLNTPFGTTRHANVQLGKGLTWMQILKVSLRLVIGRKVVLGDWTSEAATAVYYVGLDGTKIREDSRLANTYKVENPKEHC